MIDHIGLSVQNYDTMKSFYEKALAPLGYGVVGEYLPPMTAHKMGGLGKNQKGDLWISEEGKTTPHAHIAFVAETRAEVDAFYDAALAAGGIDNGKPGLRPEYHENYYGAFVLDPEGHNAEVVCHKPE